MMAGPNSAPPGTLPTQQRVEGLVSVIVPVYNRPAQLIDAIDSAATQDYPHIEVIVVDDGSTDGRTPAAAAMLAGRYPGVVTPLRMANGGPGLAREQGRKLARGEFIQYLDSDDVLLPGKLAAQVAALRAHPEADVAYGITLFRHADGRLEPGPHKDTGIIRPRMFPAFLHSRWWETATPLYRASICDLAGPWSELRLEEDWEYDCRIACLGGVLVHVNLPVSEHRDHGGQRLSRGAAVDPRRLAMRARAHALVWGHAQRAGLPSSHPDDVAHFARALFLLARQCGMAGLERESRQLLDLAAAAALRGRARAQIPVYRVAAGLLGYARVARLAGWVERVRSIPAVPGGDPA
jgi:hypothetical protein